jgi:hypothetical protein
VTLSHWNCGETITELTDNNTRLMIDLSESYDVALEWGNGLKDCLEEKQLRPVPRKLFDAVSEKTGVAFDYDNQTHQGVVRELLSETFRGRE